MEKPPEPGGFFEGFDFVFLEKAKRERAVFQSGVLLPAEIAFWKNIGSFFSAKNTKHGFPGLQLSRKRVLVRGLTVRGARSVQRSRFHSSCRLQIPVWHRPAFLRTFSAYSPLPFWYPSAKRTP